MKEVFIYFIRILSSYLLTVNTVFLHYVDCKKKNTKLIQYQNFLRETLRHESFISVFLDKRAETSLDRHRELLKKISRKLDKIIPKQIEIDIEISQEKS
jgi:small-conductance mechanosensitive channel